MVQRKNELFRCTKSALSGESVFCSSEIPRVVLDTDLFPVGDRQSSTLGCLQCEHMPLTSSDATVLVQFIYFCSGAPSNG